MDATDSYEQEIERWWVRRVAALTGPTGWLAVVGLHWLHVGVNSMGSDPGCVVVLPEGKALSHVGTIEISSEGTATLRAAEASGLTNEGRDVTELVLRDDAEGDPTVVRLGSVSMNLINRDGRLGMRVRDADSQARAAFRGIERFPVDPRWRVEATLTPFDPPRHVRVPTILGFEETSRVLGLLTFGAEGMEHHLSAFAEVGTIDLFIVFGDATNGGDTYGGGRYLYCSPPDPQQRVVVDFNRAYNPPCVFTPHATCVLPLTENKLPIRVEAGEKRY